MDGNLKKLRAAIIGTGFVARTHLDALRRLGNVEVMAICSGQLERAQKLAGDFGIEIAESDYRAVLDYPDLDSVHICTVNSLHFPIAKYALEACKHVICEKPLTMSANQAQTLTDLARSTGRRNCTCHNLRFYPMVQQMRRMCEAGDLGEILTVQGTYSQDWLLYPTDWNWRLDPEQNGASRTMADIGSHWCDMAEHVTGQRITSLCADLQTFHKTRERPAGPVETFAGKSAAAGQTELVRMSSEDFGAVIFHMGDRTRGAFTASQVAAGRKNRLNLEIYGAKSSVAWDQEWPDELWIGNRNTPNEILIKDPSLLKDWARSYAEMPGGHSEGYEGTFRQIFRRFYASIADPSLQPEYPQFADGLRQMRILETELESHRQRCWMDVVD